MQSVLQVMMKMHFRHVLVRQWTLELKCPVWMRKLILQVE